MAEAPFSVLFEDNHCLAVNKPARLLTMGDATGEPTLLEAAKTYVKRKYEKPGAVVLGVVQRLDRPVSGVVLVARTSKAAARRAISAAEYPALNPASMFTTTTPAEQALSMVSSGATPPNAAP